MELQKLASFISELCDLLYINLCAYNVPGAQYS